MSQFITFLGDDLINALGWTFVHTLWQGCLIVLLMIFVLQRIPTKNAVLRYTIATASMFSMLVAAVATFALHYFEPGQSGSIASFATSERVVVESASSFSLINWLGDHLSAMVAIWIVGVILLACRMVFGLAYIQYLRSTASDLSFKLGGRVKAIAKEIDYKRPLDIAESALVQIPVVVGYLKPMILFPIGAINQLTNDEVEAVLAHEIAHLVRNDFVQNIVQSVIEIIFYYHPAVWWISAVVRSERENCCDDLAIEVCGSSFTYARALVRLQEVGQTAPAFALPFSGSKNHLLNRVKRILNEPHNKSNLMEKITATGLLLLCLVFASFNDGTEKTQVQNADVQEMTVRNQRVHRVSLTVRDTIIPQKSHTIIIEETNGKEVRLEVENGEIKQLVVDGEEIPESRYDEYADYIDQLQSQIPSAPVPPISPVAPIPHIAQQPPTPVAPPAAMRWSPAAPISADAPAAPSAVLPLMPPMPPMPPMPNAAPLPPMLVAPPSPNGHGMLFEFDGNSDFILHNAESNVTTTRTRSTIIREIDENGNISYHIDGAHADDTKIEIDYATGTAIIDGQEIIIDADSIIIIEEVETGPRGYAFFASPNGAHLNSNWIMEYADESNFNFDADKFNIVLDEISELWIKSDDNLNNHKEENYSILIADSINWLHQDGHVLPNSSLENLHELENIYLFKAKGDSAGVKARFLRRDDVDHMKYKTLKKEHVESVEAMRKARKDELKSLKKKQSSKKDQSGIIDLEVESTYVINAESGDEKSVTVTVSSSDNEDEKWMTKTVTVNSIDNDDNTWVTEVATVDLIGRNEITWGATDSFLVDQDERSFKLFGDAKFESTNINGDAILLEADEITIDLVGNDGNATQQDYKVIVKEVKQTDSDGNVVEGKIAYKVIVEDVKSQSNNHSENNN